MSPDSHRDARRPAAGPADSPSERAASARQADDDAGAGSEAGGRAGVRRGVDGDLDEAGIAGARAYETPEASRPHEKLAGGMAGRTRVARAPGRRRLPSAVLLSIHDDVEEMLDLAASLGYGVREVIVQRRRDPDVRTFLGPGKIREVAEAMVRTGAQVVLVNDTLRPGQVLRLERALEDALEKEREAHGEPGEREGRRAASSGPDGRTEGPVDRVRELDRPLVGDDMPRLSGVSFDVLDRVRVILEIFRRRARSQEARLQVELARLRYEVPLVREVIHLARSGEHPGFLAGGAYGVDQYHERIRRRMRRIRAELRHVRQDRDVRRQHRRRAGLHLVSLAGYTNAGKSSLLEVLTDEDALVEDRLFSTVATRTRRASWDRREVLATDTVGFIEDLPPWLVEAFRSTLEEIALADVILLVVDASDPPPEVERKLTSSLAVLNGFAGRLEDPGSEGSWTARGPDRWDPTPAHGVADGQAEGSSGKGAAAPNRGSDAPVEAGPVGRTGPAVPGGLAPIVLVLNKRDRLPDRALEALVERLDEAGLLLDSWVAVSARSGSNLVALRDAVVGLLPEYDAYDVVLPQDPASEPFVAWIHEHAHVEEEARGERVRMRFEARPRHASRIRERTEAVGGRILQGPTVGTAGDDAVHDGAVVAEAADGADRDADEDAP